MTLLAAVVMMVAVRIQLHYIALISLSATIAFHMVRPINPCCPLRFKFGSNGCVAVWLTPKPTIP